MRNRDAFIILAGLAAVITPSCSIRDEGAVDFRPFISAENTEVDQAESDRKTISCGSLSGCEDISFNQKYSIIPSDFGAAILEGDYFQIQLKNGFVKEFTDVDTRGDIAILARLYEIGHVPTTINLSRADLGDAKLIFYSDDVRHGQYLNISQTPMFGPLEYHGGPVVLELYGVDVDELSEGMKALIGSLITQGAQVASAVNPAAGAVAGVVGNLGEALLSGNSDDIIFAYRMSFAAARFSQYVPQDYFLESERVFVRSNDRTSQFRWENVQFDPGTAKLKYKDDPTEPEGYKAGDEFRGETYFVVDIVRTVPGQHPIESQTYAGLLDDIRAGGQITPEEAKQLSERIANAVNSSLARDTLSSKLSVARDPGQLQEKRAISLKDFLQTIKNMRDAETKGDTPALPSLEQQEYLNSLRIWIAGTHPKTSGELLKRLDAVESEPDLYAFANELLIPDPI